MSRPLLPADVAPDGLDEPFWEGCARGELLVHRCGVCGRCYWPATCCVEHGAAAMAWVPASGRGTVHTFTVYHHPFDPSLVDRLPYVVAVVLLEEGPFFHCDLVECTPDEVQIGMPVEVVFDPLAPGQALPRFRPAPS